MPTALASPSAVAQASASPWLRALFAAGAFYVCWCVARILFMVVPAALRGIEVDVWVFVRTAWGVWGIATEPAQLAFGGLSLAFQALAAALSGGARGGLMAASAVAAFFSIGMSRFGPGASVPLSLFVLVLVGVVPGLVGPKLAELSMKEV